MDKNIVHVNRDVSFIDEFPKDEIHHGLEGRWGICKAEEHDHWFEQTAVRFKGCFPLVAIADTYVIVTPSDIQLCKECRSATMHPREAIHEFLYQW